jgi:DNA-directed RNA polymerase specialized sigma24 family protein
VDDHASLLAPANVAVERTADFQDAGTRAGIQEGFCYLGDTGRVAGAQPPIDTGGDHVDVGKEVRRMALAYVKKCPWAELEDLEQQAWVTALECLRTWDERRKTPLTSYLRKAIGYNLRNYLWGLRSPVSGRKNHHYETLIDVQKVSEPALHDRKTPDILELALERDYRDVLTHRVREIISSVKHAQIARQFFLDGMSASQLARKKRWKREKVLQITFGTRKRIRSDGILRDAIAAGM